MKKVLFVDDEVLILYMINEFFKEFGDFEVFTARNGEEALEVMKREEISVIVTDIQMPIMNGLQLCKEIRKFDQTASVIALTAFQKLFKYMRFREEGFDDCLKKPFDPEELQEVIEYSFKKVARCKKLFNESQRQTSNCSN
ncbi:MAG: response regulator [Lentisphaeraceae bacterium]|nr:response regulator [Lentisphaeraceae bacterium]